tara:strand:+ start:141 stop:983 length:843 start_codon:yes stop_codon:yes gene_type:complete
LDEIVIIKVEIGQMAKIIFLGTAGSTSVLTKHGRLSGGIIIQTDEAQLHINPGPGIITGARSVGVDLRNTISFLVTDSNLLNCDDLNLAIDIMTFSGIERRGLLVGSNSVINGSEDENPFLSVRHKNLLEKVIVLEGDNKIGLGLVEIHPIKVNAKDKSAVGYKLMFPKFTLSYPGTTVYSEELVEQLKESDILILNMPKLERAEDEKVLDVFAVQELLRSVKPKLAVLTGFGNEIIREGSIDVVREIQRATNVQCIAAKDGLILSPEGLEKHSPVRGYN